MQSLIAVQRGPFPIPCFPPPDEQQDLHYIDLEARSFDNNIVKLYLVLMTVNKYNPEP